MSHAFAPTPPAPTSRRNPCHTSSMPFARPMHSALATRCVVFMPSPCEARKATATRTPACAPCTSPWPWPGSSQLQQQAGSFFAVVMTGSSIATKRSRQCPRTCSRGPARRLRPARRCKRRPHCPLQRWCKPCRRFRTRVPHRWSVTRSSRRPVPCPRRLRANSPQRCRPGGRSQERIRARPAVRVLARVSARR